MNRYFIESFKIKNLWGYQDTNLDFNRDVNILIGPNASGKTTILNLLHAILLPDLPNLLDVGFDEAEIKLKGFTGRTVRTVKVEVDPRFLKLSVGSNKCEIEVDSLSERKLMRYYRHADRNNAIRGMPIRHFIRGRIVPTELYDELANLVPLAWLPVSRRLPVTEREEERFTTLGPLESVDVRLHELLAEELSDYHSRLNSQLSDRYKAFEHQVLSEMLYSRDHDQLDLIPSSSPTQADKKQLLRAFEAAGLLDEKMRNRIDEHFAVAEEVLQRIGKNPTVLDGKDALVLSLVRQTKAMVEYAEKLEEYREQIFAPLRLYEKIVNSFLNEKSVNVDESGKLKIESSSSPSLNARHLSSGEKQILILLTQALLEVDGPVVYIADEPELSLHVSWQEKLLESLVMLGGQIQVIVATHSPDIVGRFRDKVIQLGRKS